MTSPSGEVSRCLGVGSLGTLLCAGAAAGSDGAGAVVDEPGSPTCGARGVPSGPRTGAGAPADGAGSGVTRTVATEGPPAGGRGRAGAGGTGGGGGSGVTRTVATEGPPAGVRVGAGAEETGAVAGVGTTVTRSTGATEALLGQRSYATIALVTASTRIDEATRIPVVQRLVM